MSEVWPGVVFGVLVVILSIICGNFMMNRATDIGTSDRAAAASAVVGVACFIVAFMFGWATVAVALGEAPEPVAPEAWRPGR